MGAVILIKDLNPKWRLLATVSGFNDSDKAMTFCIIHLRNLEWSKIGETADDMGISQDACYQWRRRDGASTNSKKLRENMRKNVKKSKMIDAEIEKAVRYKKALKIAKKWLNGKSVIDCTGIKNQNHAARYVSHLRSVYGEDLFPLRKKRIS